ncbi:hypothetical protein [Rhodococcus sp. P1Y]|uniref:hypothetical protein n=1 Tax=Rhodococcus sp. P1Y TaxID=1302308 RepID=UPI000EB5622E|nr:hypothetical protein [Rhodococcus sp. P1Y]AYJ48992.1 hypothetical protein D8W71_12325 [Rhodococcus sp. P1Y]
MTTNSAPNTSAHYLTARELKVLRVLDGHGPQTLKTLRNLTGLPKAVIWTLTSALSDLGDIAEDRTVPQSQETQYVITDKARLELHA